MMNDNGKKFIDSFLKNLSDLDRESRKEKRKLIYDRPLNDRKKIGDFKYDPKDVIGNIWYAYIRGDIDEYDRNYFLNEEAKKQRRENQLNNKSKKVFNMSQDKLDYIKDNEYFKNHKFKEISIDDLIKHNDLDNKTNLSNHAQNWSETGKEEDIDPTKFKYDVLKDNDSKDVIYGTQKNGLYKLSNGRHRVRALKNDGYTHINIPIYDDNKKV